MTYAQSEDTKELPVPCCNGPSCNSVEPDFIQREPFMDTTNPPITEADREWIVCQTLELKRWRTETSTRFWEASGVKKRMPEGLTMPDNCLVALAKSGGLLATLTQLIKFLEPWHGVSKYADEIFLCLETNCPPLEPKIELPFQLPSKAQRKANLQALCASKKLKNMDDPIIAQDAQMTALRDQWLTARGKATPETKARIKKAADAEKKKAEKEDKACKKTRSKNQFLDIRRLALNNSQAIEVGTFREILSDPPTALNEPTSNIGDPSTPTAPLEAPLTGRRTLSDKKQVKSQALAGRLVAKGSTKTKTPREPTPPPVAMELIQPGKQRVRIPANAVENTPPKQMGEL